jgi:hypothetical protein
MEPRPKMMMVMVMVMILGHKWEGGWSEWGISGRGGARRLKYTTCLCSKRQHNEIYVYIHIHQTLYKKGAEGEDIMERGNLFKVHYTHI